MFHFEQYRADFERLHSPGSYGFKRSLKGNYVNPALARDWKWFCMGLIARGKEVESLQWELNRA